MQLWREKVSVEKIARKDLLRRGAEQISRVRSNNASLELLDITNSLSSQQQEGPKLTEPNLDRDIEIKIFNFNSESNTGNIIGEKPQESPKKRVLASREGQEDWGGFLLNTQHQFQYRPSGIDQEYKKVDTYQRNNRTALQDYLDIQLDLLSVQN